MVMSHNWSKYWQIHLLFGVLTNKTIFQPGEKTFYVQKTFLELIVHSLNIHVNRNKNAN